MAQRNYRERVARAHFSLGFFSFLRGGGTGASAPAAPAAPSFFTTFLTTFFLGASAAGAGAGDVGVAGAAGEVGVAGGVSVIDDSICAAMEDLPLAGALTPICASETAPTGDVGEVTAGEAAAGGAAGERSSCAMMSEASAAASSSSLSGVGSGSAAAGGLNFSLPAGLRRSSATQPILAFILSSD